MTMMFLKIFFREKKKQTKIGISFKKRIVLFSLTEAIINVDIYTCIWGIKFYQFIYMYIGLFFHRIKISQFNFTNEVF